MNEFWGRPLLSSAYWFLIKILNKARHLLKIPIQNLGLIALTASWFEILYTTTVLTLYFPEGSSRQAFHVTLGAETNCLLLNNDCLHLYKMLMKAFSHAVTFSNIPVCPFLTIWWSLCIGILYQRCGGGGVFVLVFYSLNWSPKSSCWDWRTLQAIG